MEYFVLYLCVSIEKIAAFLAMGGNVFFWSIFAYVGLWMTALLLSSSEQSFKEKVQKMKKHRKMTVAFACIGAVLYSVSVLMPTKKELAVIVGAGVTYNVVTSQSAKEIGGKAVELLKKEIDKALKDEDVNQVVPKIKDKAVEEVKSAAKEVLNV